MRMLVLTCGMLVLVGTCHAEVPNPGEPVDLAPFGHAKTWDGNPGVEWDEPREVKRVEVDLPAGHVPPPDSLRVEYWVSSWPPRTSGGWTKTDTSWQGEWRAVEAEVEANGGTVVHQCKPLSETENPNARNVPGFAPTFRKTLKVRLNFSENPSSYSGLRIFGNSHWNQREINLQSGLEGKPRADLSVA